MAIPFNPLLWGCESWAMFHLRYIRRILGIRWTNVIDFNITNDRKKINNLRNIEYQIARRILVELFECQIQKYQQDLSQPPVMVIDPCTIRHSI